MFRFDDIARPFTLLAVLFICYFGSGASRVSLDNRSRDLSRFLWPTVSFVRIVFDTLWQYPPVGHGVVGFRMCNFTQTVYRICNMLGTG